MRERFVRFKNIKVSFTDSGKGRAVVFLHGFLGSKEIWEGFTNKLSKRIRVITIDLLGHGNTECLSYIHTMEEMAEAVKHVLDHLGLRKYFLIGHSMGGYVSLALAESNPDAIKGLCMFHSTATADSDKKKKDRDRAIKVVKRSTQLYIDEAIPNLFNTKWKPHKRGILRAKKIAQKVTRQGIVAALEGMKIRMDREIVLKFAPYPILYLIGKEDNVLDYEDLIQQTKIMASGECKVFNGVGHMGFIEARAETVASLNSFVTKNY